MVIRKFQQQIYAGKTPATLIGYDGISPGPSFVVPVGSETIVRVINNITDAQSIFMAHRLGHHLMAEPKTSRSPASVRIITCQTTSPAAPCGTTTMLCSRYVMCKMFTVGKPRSCPLDFGLTGISHQGRPAFTLENSC